MFSGERKVGLRETRRERMRLNCGQKARLRTPSPVYLLYKRERLGNRIRPSHRASVSNHLLSCSRCVSKQMQRGSGQAGGGGGGRDCRFWLHGTCSRGQ